MEKVSGSHEIVLGSSFRPPTRHDTTATTTYHGIKLNFQPGTLDHGRHALLSSSHVVGSSSTSSAPEYTLTVPSREDETQQHIFKGTQVAGRDVDCLLIWSEARQQYVLERIDSVLRLEHQRPGPSATTTARTTARAKAAAAAVRDTAPRNGGGSKVESTLSKDERGSTGSVMPDAKRHVETDDGNHLSVRETARTSHARRKTAVEHELVLPPQSRTTQATLPTTPQQAHVRNKEEVRDVEDEDEAEDEDDLDDLADMLESTLDESRGSKPAPVHAIATTLSVARAGNDESSEEED